ncbi:hypothetical protein Tco_0843925 [Tanacetum coccineum]
MPEGINQRANTSGFYCGTDRRKNPDVPMTEPEGIPEPWTLFTNGSSCIDGSRAGLILTNSEGVEFTYAMRHDPIFEQVKNAHKNLNEFSIKQIPRCENKKAVDALIKQRFYPQALHITATGKYVSDNGNTRYATTPIQRWVRGTSFKPGDMVYRSNDASHARDGGKLGPKWEDTVTKFAGTSLGKGAYQT